MMNREYFINLKSVLDQNDEMAICDALNGLREELEYELTEQLMDHKFEELNDQLHSSKRIKKMLTGFVDHDVSYQIGIIMGILQITEAFVHRQTVQKKTDIRISALFEKEINKKILLYLYDHPSSQHKVIAEALAMRPNYLSQQMRELEEAGGVVRYGVDRRSFYELTLDGQAFIEKMKKDKKDSVFTYDLMSKMGLDEKSTYGQAAYGDISEKRNVLMVGENRTPYCYKNNTYAKEVREDIIHAK